MHKKPDLLLVLVIIFGLGVVLSGFSASQSSQAAVPSAGQMSGL